MINKSFREAFNGLRLSEDIDMYFDDVTLLRGIFERDTSTMFVYIFSTHLISYMNICKAEQQLKEHIFGEYSKCKVKIVDKYGLSDAYTTEHIMRVYYDSFIREIGDYQYMTSRLLLASKYSVSGDTITFDIVEGIAAESKRGDIENYFVKTFAERFDRSVAVRINLIRKPETAPEPEAVSVPETVETSSTKRIDEMYSAMAAAYDEETNGISIDVIQNFEIKHDDTPKKKDYKANAEKYKRKNYSDKDCFYGRNVEGEITPIAEIDSNAVGEFVVRGQVFKIETKQIKSGKYLITANITDFTDSIGFKLFVAPDDKDPILEDLVEGNFYCIKGSVDYDDYTREMAFRSVNGMKMIADFRNTRQDTATTKRVELHLHTKFSDNDAVADVKKVIQRAINYGHKAVAITDHGVAQAFPVANTFLKYDAKNAPEDFKIIYGIEAYLVNDIKTLVMNGHGQSLESEYVVFDIETTGLSFKFCKIIEIGAVRIDKTGKEIARFSEFVNPEMPIPYSITKLTSITDSMVKDADTIDKVMPRFLEFCKDAILVAHNATFDTTFIRVNAKRLGLTYDFTALDTMTLAHVYLPNLGRYNLDRLTNYFKLKNAHHHRACDDADVTAQIFMELLKLVRESGVDTIDELNKVGSASEDAIRKAKSYHGVLLCKNDKGRVNLYRLISESHLKYFNQRPKIPMSLLEKYRGGLLVGSGCASGELMQALLDGAEEEEIERIVRYYDYLEIMPIGNNYAFIEDEKKANINSVEDLQDLNRQIIGLGEKYGKTVVATGDVHFIDPDDVIYRTIVLEGSRKDSGKKDEEFHEPYHPPLYFRTTDEMLDEFSYLGKDKAYEVVVENTNKIADMIEKISPVRPDKAPPIIENSDKTLREICEKRAHEMYGPVLPDILRERLDKELDSIISNGYSVMYILAQKLVWKSNDDGYMVGSRGSVGSSVAATMAGITEVNPLPAHYLCPSCYYYEFDSERVKAFSGMSGCDMPDAVCPNCGKPLRKEGHDIPFETFLGFNGDKEPDIDLNFSGEYQPKAHAYIEEMFGKGYAFRAGTIGTLAEKTAYGYAKKYCEKRGLTKRRAELERLADGCVGVKRTTGQHPGGIIVLPSHEEIYSFTPIQHPANDMTTDIVTTHFEYHSIQSNLLKFDILGHDDPTMIRRLEDLTGTKATDVPLDDKNVMALYKGTEVLGITPKDIGGIPLGCLGTPEFGTEFAMQMLIDADPQNFSDLVRITGLAHGTDVWLGNAQTLIQEGKCKLSSAICCRDDIMIYLIHMGLEKGLAFNIMEKVRKGKGLTPEWEEEMRAHDIPEWYLWSCNKIKYMFPKAHAVAYVMMSWRVAYYKLYYPLAYYCAFYSIRATAFSYEIMCQGESHLDAYLDKYNKMDKNSMTATEQDLLRDMRIVKEMYRRGIEFAPIDIYKARGDRFQIVDGKLMPSFVSIDGMGAKAAAQLEEAAKDGEFVSQQDLKNRAKVPASVIEKMAEFGILGDMPEEGQLRFKFDEE